jgi:hypothetical protein
MDIKTITEMDVRSPGDVLSLWMFCPHLHFVSWMLLCVSGRFVPTDILSAGRFVPPDLLPPDVLPGNPVFSAKSKKYF